MKKGIPAQLVVALVILLAGGGFLAAEFSLAKWYPRYRLLVKDKTLKPIAFVDPSLGVELLVSTGIYAQAETFPGGVRIFRPKFWGIEPSLTITTQPNPDRSFSFSPAVLAKWETQGAYEGLPRFHYEHTNINNRDAVLIWQFKGRAMQLTARVISPDRMIEVECSPGTEDEDLYMQACDSTVRTLKVKGPEPPPTQPTGALEIISPPR